MRRRCSGPHLTSANPSPCEHTFGAIFGYARAPFASMDSSVSLMRCPPCLLEKMKELRRRPDFPEATPYRVDGGPLEGMWILSLGRRFGDEREEPPAVYCKREAKIWSRCPRLAKVFRAIRAAKG